MDLSDSEPGSASAGLSYSYETCGNLNTYSETRHLKYLRGKHLRVSYPGDSGSGYSELYECSSCLLILLIAEVPVAVAALLTLPDESKAGSVVDFMREIAREAQFTWEVVPILDESRSLYSSSFTACVHQVHLGAYGNAM